jgi:hypothetical protein
MSDSTLFNIDLLKIDEIVINNASIENNTQLSSLEKDKYYFDIEYGFIPGINIVQKKIRIIFGCDIKTFKNSKELIQIGGRFEIAYFFEVENLDALARIGEEIEINSDLVTSLANIAYSTSRGIIYTRCQGTILRKLILPVMSTSTLVDMLMPQESSGSKVIND